MAKDITLFKNDGALYFRLIHKKEEIINLECDGFLLDMEEKEARRTIESIKQRNKKILFAIFSKDDEFNRRALETLKINFLVSPENSSGKDNLKQRSSGFSHILAEIAKKNKIQIVVDLSWLNLFNGKKKAIVFSRIIQNIKLCRKAKMDLKFATFAKNESELLDEKQIKSIGFSLGMSSKQTESMCNF